MDAPTSQTTFPSWVGAVPAHGGDFVPPLVERLPVYFVVGEPALRAVLARAILRLNLDPALAEDLLDSPPASVSPGQSFAGEGLRLAAGDRVVLTGTMQRGRAEIEAEATAAGLRMTASVSRATKVVVAADPDSMSGKAERARAAGIPVVGEECFFSALAGMPGCH